MSALMLVTVSGGAAARGEAYGREAGGLIAKALDLYRGFLRTKGLGWDEALATAGEFVPYIGNFDADCLTEIEAIARASGRTREEIVLLNARTELLYWHGQKRREGVIAPPDECTGAIVTPEATRDGTLIHAQNWDWMPQVADHTMVLRVRDHDGPNALHVLEAGQLARHGMNEEGLCVSAMGLHSDRDYGKLGVPSPVLRRKMIHAPNMGAAIGALHADDTSFSHAVAVSHARGEAFMFETLPGDVFCLEPDAGVLVHANHIKSPLALKRARDANLVRCPDSLYRDQRLRRLLCARRGDITLEDVTGALSDRAHAPDAILRAPAQRQGGLASATVYTLAMLPSEGRAFVSLAPYASDPANESRFAEFTIN